MSIGLIVLIAAMVGLLLVVLGLWMHQKDKNNSSTGQDEESFVDDVWDGLKKAETVVETEMKEDYNKVKKAFKKAEDVVEDEVKDDVKKVKKAVKKAFQKVKKKVSKKKAKKKTTK